MKMSENLKCSDSRQKFSKTDRKVHRAINKISKDVGPIFCKEPTNVRPFLINNFLWFILFEIMFHSKLYFIPNFSTFSIFVKFLQAKNKSIQKHTKCLFQGVNLSFLLYRLQGHCNHRSTLVQ